MKKKYRPKFGKKYPASTAPFKRKIYTFVEQYRNTCPVLKIFKLHFSYTMQGLHQAET
jgi:hypothetical protein